jgi:hypothetical protein
MAHIPVILEPCELLTVAVGGSGENWTSTIDSSRYSPVLVENMFLARVFGFREILEQVA